MARNRLRFEASRDDSRYYCVLKITAYVGTKPTNYNGCVELRFQADTSYLQGGWGSGDFTIEADCLDSLKQSSRIVRRLIGGKDQSPYGSPSLELVASRLERAEQVVWDPRLSKRVPVAEVLPNSFEQWWDNPTGYASVLAESEADAQDAILHALADGQRLEYLAEWLQAGRPVTRSRWNSAPDAGTLAELMILPEPEPEPEPELEAESEPEPFELDPPATQDEAEAWADYCADAELEDEAEAESD